MEDDLPLCLYLDKKVCETSICPGEYFSTKIFFPVKIISIPGNLLRVFPLNIIILNPGNFSKIIKKKVKLVKIKSFMCKKKFINLKLPRGEWGIV